MDKRKDYTISDKILIVRQILEAVENHNNVKLELTVFSQSNSNNDLGKLCDKFNLHKKINRQEHFEWAWYHNGSNKQSALDSNILISVFK